MYTRHINCRLNLTMSFILSRFSHISYQRGNYHYMLYRFLQIFPTGFLRSFNNISNTILLTFFPKGFWGRIINFKYHMSYFLFSPPGFLKEVYKAYLLFSKLTYEFFLFKVFSYELPRDNKHYMLHHFLLISHRV